MENWLIFFQTYFFIFSIHTYTYTSEQDSINYLATLLRAPKSKQTSFPTLKMV